MNRTVHQWPFSFDPYKLHWGKTFFAMTGAFCFVTRCSVIAKTTMFSFFITQGSSLCLNCLLKPLTFQEATIIEFSVRVNQESCPLRVCCSAPFLPRTSIAAWNTCWKVVSCSGLKQLLKSPWALSWLVPTRCLLVDFPFTCFHPSSFTIWVTNSVPTAGWSCLFIHICWFFFYSYFLSALVYSV